jgi:hypothetical protein
VRRFILLLAAMAILAGCTSTVEGNGSAQQTNTADTRPRDLPLNNIDPCTLLTPAQRRTLGLDNLDYRDTSTVPIFSGPSCTFIGFEPRSVSVDITLVVDNGLDALTQPGAIQGEVTPTLVANFPAVILRSPSLTGFCSLNIDVATGQFLNIEFDDAGEQPPIAYEQLCRDATQTAEQIILTLQGDA